MAQYHRKRWHSITGKDGTVSPEKMAQLRPVAPVNAWFGTRRQTLNPFIALNRHPIFHYKKSFNSKTTTKNNS
jgi:hypothetical protein